MIFNKSGRKINKDKFIFNNSALEYCTEYKYLGILFKPTGSFTEATNLLCKKASKAIFCIRKLLFSESNNILPHIKLFETCVIISFFTTVRSGLLILLKIIKFLSQNTVKIQIKFSKFLIGVNKAAVNAAVFGNVSSVYSSP